MGCALLSHEFHLLLSLRFILQQCALSPESLLHGVYLCSSLRCDQDVGRDTEENVITCFAESWLNKCMDVIICTFS